MKLRLKKIPPFDARRGGLKRSQCSGIDLQHGRRTASADVWDAPDGHTLLRFRACGQREYFRATLFDGAPAGRLSCRQLERVVHDELAAWFCDVSDKQED